MTRTTKILLGAVAIAVIAAGASYAGGIWGGSNNCYFWCGSQPGGWLN